MIKSLSQLLLPPGGLILLGLFGLYYWREFWGRLLVCCALVMLWLLATEPVRDLLSAPLEYEYPPLTASSLPHDDAVIVVLGAGVYADAPEYGGSDELAGAGLMRTLYAADLAVRSGLPVYASGGAPLNEDEAEGLVMRRWLIRFGIAPERVVAEVSANNSWENAVNVRMMLKERGIGRVVLVTSSWHMPRARWSFQAQGIEVLPAPCDYLTKRGGYDLRSFLPGWHVLGDSGQTLHEYLGLLWYRLRFGN